mmetsp:Transcript_59373/g.152893  ORF Transcript_59373/g.152893 Transcript_59373/m.152893 type:complete len:236 (-) Transcript_59373:633-1340(-)
MQLHAFILELLVTEASDQVLLQLHRILRRHLRHLRRRRSRLAWRRLHLRIGLLRLRAFGRGGCWRAWRCLQVVDTHDEQVPLGPNRLGVGVRGQVALDLFHEAPLLHYLGPAQVGRKGLFHLQHRGVAHHSDEHFVLAFNGVLHLHLHLGCNLRLHCLGSLWCWLRSWRRGIEDLVDLPACPREFLKLVELWVLVEKCHHLHDALRAALKAILRQHHALHREEELLALCLELPRV